MRTSIHQKINPHSKRDRVQSVDLFAKSRRVFLALAARRLISRWVFAIDFWACVFAIDFWAFLSFFGMLACFTIFYQGLLSIWAFSSLASGWREHDLNNNFFSFHSVHHPLKKPKTMANNPRNFNPNKLFFTKNFNYFLQPAPSIKNVKIMPTRGRSPRVGISCIIYPSQLVHEKMSSEPRSKLYR